MKSRVVVLIALAALVAAATSSVQTDGSAVRASPDWSKQWVQVKSLVTGASIPGSEARLTRDASFGIRNAKIESYSLPPGHVIMAVWAVFNNPDACTAGNPVTGARCGPGDLANAETGASVQFWADGVVSREDGMFKVSGGRLAVGETSGCYQPAPPPCRSGLTNVQGSEIHVVLRDKGLLIPERFEEQRRNFFGGCDVYACSNPQAAQFLP